MCEIDWGLTAAMLAGIGTFLAGIAAIFVLPWQLGFRKEAKSLKESAKIMLPIYKNYMASEEGIIWGDYPKDAEKIINGISRSIGLETQLVRSMLDDLKQEGKI